MHCALEHCVISLCQVVCCDWWWKVWADEEMLHCLLLAAVTGIRPGSVIPLTMLVLQHLTWLFRLFRLFQMVHSKWAPSEVSPLQWSSCPVWCCLEHWGGFSIDKCVCGKWSHWGEQWKRWNYFWNAGVMFQECVGTWDGIGRFVA